VLRPSTGVGFVIVLGLLTAPLRAQGTRTVRDPANRCQATVPADWIDVRGGAQAGHDPHFSINLRGVLAAERPAELEALKHLHATVVVENDDGVLLSVPIPGGTGRKQFVEMTKTSPMGCRATITYPDASSEAAARRIAESVTSVK
jgi:hypothetical protein